MIDLGTVRPGTTLYIPFATYDSNDPSASVTLTGLATTDIEIYKDGSVTQRGSDNGYALLDTDGIDFDGVTGIHGFSIDLADNTTAGFYAAGSQYWVVVASVTVDSGTINFIAATFRIGYPDAVLNTTIATLASQTSFTLTAGPADDNALVGCVCVVHDVASAVQIAQGVVSAYTGATKTVTLAVDPGIFTMAAGDNIAFFPGVNVRYVSEDKAAADTLELFAEALDQATGKLDSGTLTDGTITAASIAADAITADKIADDAIAAEHIATGAIVAATFAAGAIDAAAIANGAIDAATFAADVDAEVRSYVGLASANLDTQLADLPTVSEFEARTLPSADYVVTTDTIAGVTNVGTVTGNVNGSVGSVTGGINTAAGTITTLDGLDTEQDAQHAITQAAISGMGSGTGAALNFEVVEDNATEAIKTITAVGTPTGTYANTLADDGTVHSIASDGNVIRWVYGFSVGAGRSASKVDIRASVDGNNDIVTVSAYNFVTTAWDARTTISATVETLYDIPLLASHTGTGADEGKVYVRFDFSEGDATTLSIDQCYVQAAQSGSLVGYALGAIWVNTLVTNENTVPYVDGTADNPVSTWAAALTLSGLLGINRFKIGAASSITLTADSSEYELLGDGLWTLALGGQDISNSYIQKASISGVSTGSNAIIEDSLIGEGTSTGPGYFVRCGFNTSSGSPFLAAAAGQYVFVDCVSTVAGSGTPYFNFAGTGSTTGVNFRRWSGGSHNTGDSNVTGTMEVVTGGGQTIVTGGGSWELRGICRAVTITLTGSETVQVAAVTGPVAIGGAGASSTVRLYGVHGVVTNTASGTPTVDDFGVSLVNVNAEVDTALNTAIPGSPVADSINERVKAIDDKLPSRDYLAGSAAATGETQTDVEAALEADPTINKLDSQIQVTP